MPSSFIREILRDWQKVPEHKIDLIPYGFDPEKYENFSLETVRAIREELQMEGRFVIGTFARLSEEKGHRFLVRALTKVRDQIGNILWLIVGEGSERVAIEAKSPQQTG